MKLRIALDIDDVLFRTEDMEVDYCKNKMEQDGYTLQGDDLLRNGVFVTNKNTPQAVQIIEHYVSLRIPDKCYTDPAYMDTTLVDAVKQCQEKHPDWEFVVITSRAANREVMECLSRTQQRKYAQFRKENKELIKQFLDINEFYFTRDKGACMVEHSIDVLLDDCLPFLEVAISYGKFGIHRLPSKRNITVTSEDLDNSERFYSLSSFQHFLIILEHIEDILNGSIGDAEKITEVFDRGR